MQTFQRDLIYALRGLRRQPTFALLAVLALALGIGSATTIFSVIQNVLLDPFPYRDADRVVGLQIRDGANPRQFRNFLQVPELLDYQAGLGDMFEDSIAGGFEDVLYTTAEGTEQFNGGLTSGNTFEFLGVPAALGRTLIPDDAKPGAPPVFVMSHRMWTRHFAQDPGALNRTFVLNGVPTTLVGVMPPRFTKLAADLYKPVVLDRADPEGSRRFFNFQARLKPGVTREQAEARVEVIARRLAKVYPQNYPEKFTIRVVNWLDNVVGPFRTTLYTLAAAVGLLLLIACSNVANMLLARATTRQKEMAIRSSLGASRVRLVLQLLVESLLLAMAGALVGCGFAHFGLKAVVAAIPEGLIPREAVIRLNLPVLLFSLVAAALTTVLFGLVPALQTARRDLLEPLRDSGKGTSGGTRPGALGNALVVFEVALSLVLLAGAGLLMRSFVNLQSTDLGLNPENVLSVRLPLPRGSYATAEGKQQFLGQVLARVRALPGVVTATAASSLPPYGGIRSEIEIPGKSHPENWNSIFQLCSEDYFATLGLRLEHGRLLAEADVTGARKVALVNRTLVERYFGQEDPIGQTFRLRELARLPGAPAENPLFEIVGVVADARNQGIQEPIQPEVFLPYTITGAFERGILVRTARAPLALLQSVRREVWAVDRNVALTNAGSLTDYLRRFSYAEPRFGLVVLGVFAGVGLLLVTLGVSSVIAYTVSRQTHEIGIRMALGAGRGDVLRMVLSTGTRLIGTGVVVGVLASLALTRVLASQLWQVAPHDPLTLVSVVVVIGCAGLAAAYVPARRATRVDPMVALRYE